MFYVDDDDIMGRSAHKTEKNKETYLVANKEIVLEVNSENTKYMVMSLDQNAGRNQYVQVYDSSFERVDDLKYLGTT
jgi:hypothetical protein